MRRFRILPVGFALPALPGFEGPKTYAAWPVWSHSVTKDVRFEPITKKNAARLWHRARDFDRRTHKKRHHGGALGHAALQVLHALIFDFLNYRSGRLDPSHAAIARAANVCERTVRNALNRLRDSGVVHWVRRCAETWRDGRFMLEQETNAYAVLPASQWRGYKASPEPPPPRPGTWGDPAPMPSSMDEAARQVREGDDQRSVIRMLDSDPGDLLAAALARLGRAVRGENPQ